MPLLKVAMVVVFHYSLSGQSDYLFKATDHQQMWGIVNSRVFSFRFYGGLRPEGVEHASCCNPSDAVNSLTL